MSRMERIRKLALPTAAPKILVALRLSLSGAFALAIVAVLLVALNSELRPLAASYGSDFRFAFLSAGASLEVLALAGGLGWLGAHLSVSRHLRNIEPR